MSKQSGCPHLHISKESTRQYNTKSTITKTQQHYNKKNITNSTTQNNTKPNALRSSLAASIFTYLRWGLFPPRCA
jgi:hypothetical protein